MVKGFKGIYIPFALLSIITLVVLLTTSSGIATYKGTMNLILVMFLLGFLIVDIKNSSAESKLHNTAYKYLILIFLFLLLL